MTTISRRPRHPGRGRAASVRRGEAASGWLFTAPILVFLALFLVVPVLMALWVSFSDWGGRGSPLGSDVHFVGGRNYAAVTSGGGLPEQDFGTSLRNNLWYVLLVVPIQTMLSLLLAVLVNNRILKGAGFFRTAFYFPSVITSSVAITVLWLFLFNTSGAVNTALGFLGVHGPNWFNAPEGVLHALLGGLGIESGPRMLVGGGFLGVTWWDWLAGPSWAMSAFILLAIFTTSGTFMLLFLAALQNLSGDLLEAGMVDGAGGWQRFWRIIVPQLRTTVFTVVTLGLIGCWQVFDQVYTATKGGPDKTTLTPAFLSYQASFVGQNWGQGAAIAFILFAVIVAFTILQRVLLRERPVSRRRRLNPKP